MGSPGRLLVLGVLAVAGAVLVVVLSAVGTARHVGATFSEGRGPTSHAAPAPAPVPSKEAERRIADLEARAGASADPEEILRWCEEARPHLHDTPFELRRRGIEVRAREEKARRATDLDPLLAEIKKALSERPVVGRRRDVEALLAAALEVAGSRAAEVEPFREEYDRKIQEARHRAGLVGRWSFDEPSGPAARDTSGHGHHGQLAAGAARVPDRGGGALRVVGPSDGVDVPGSVDLEETADGSFTLSAWYRPELLPPDAEHALLVRTDPPVGLVYTRDGRFVMRHLLEGDLQASAAAPDPLPPRHWYHVAGVVDLQAGTTRVYVNGQSQRVSFWAPGTRARIPDGAGWKIGAGANGTLDDVRIYRRALGTEDVRALYAAERR